MRALDLYCCGGGISEGLQRAGFEVVGVDIETKHERVYRAGPGRLVLKNPARFVLCDALEFMEEVIRGEHGHFDLICASPPCQAHSSLRHLQKGKEYPDLIPQTRALLERWGGLWCIENVPGAPLGGSNLTMLCGTMFGLQTPDGRAELRRHRLFETSFSIPLRPACQHGHESLSVCGTGLDSGKERYRRRALNVTGHAVEVSPSNWPKRAVSVAGRCVESKRPGWTGRTGGDGMALRETFSTADARHAMGIDWMPMKQLSQAIPPVYAEWLGRQAIDYIRSKESR